MMAMALPVVIQLRERSFQALPYVRGTGHRTRPGHPLHTAHSYYLWTQIGGTTTSCLNLLPLDPPPTNITLADLNRIPWTFYALRHRFVIIHCDQSLGLDINRK